MTRNVSHPFPGLRVALQALPWVCDLGVPGRSCCSPTGGVRDPGLCPPIGVPSPAYQDGFLNNFGKYTYFS